MMFINRIELLMITCYNAIDKFISIIRRHNEKERFADWGSTADWD